MFGFFSIAAMVLTGVGIGGLVSYKLQRDIHELSVRVALGCRPTRVVGMVMWEGVAPVVIGSLVGLVIAVVLAPTIQRVTDGIVRVDYSTALVAIASVAALAVLAAGVPARQLLSANLLVSIGRKISPD